MNLGAIISPYYLLDSIFYDDYQRNIEDLSNFHSISLAANLTSKPNYVDSFLKLQFPRFLTLAQNRYMTSLSHISSAFYYIRNNIEVTYSKYFSHKLKQYFKEKDLDLLYCFPEYPENYVSNLNEDLNLPVITELWEDKIEHKCDGLRLTSFRKYTKQESKKGYNWLQNIGHASDCIIVPTEVLKNRILKSTNYKKKIFVLPVCQDALIKNDRSVIRSRKNLESKNVLFYLGSLCHYHDVETVLASLKKIKSSNVILLVAGGIGKKPFEIYSRFLKGLKIPVIYLGRLDTTELEYYISASDICLSIYKFTEPSGFFPASVVKFMLAEKPIIATDLPEIKEMFKNEKAGLFIEQRNASQLAKTIDFLLENPHERINLGKKAGEIAHKNYLWEHHSQSLTKIFNLLT